MIKKLLINTVFLIEFIYAASCLSGFLLAGVERVALGAYFYMDLLLCGSGSKLVAAVTGYFCLKILGLNAFFHFFTFLPAVSERRL